jgi:hypothetical protein
LQRGSTCLGMPSGKDKIGDKRKIHDMVCQWRAPKSRGETKLKVSQSQVAESRLGSTLPASNSRKG